MRPDWSNRAAVIRIHTTPQGIDQLANYERRNSDDFGAMTVIPTLKGRRA